MNPVFPVGHLSYELRWIQVSAHNLFSLFRSEVSTLPHGRCYAAERVYYFELFRSCANQQQRLESDCNAKISIKQTDHVKSEPNAFAQNVNSRKTSTLICNKYICKITIYVLFCFTVLVQHF